MPDLPPIDEGYLQAVLIDLLNTPSPTGFTAAAIQRVNDELKSFQNLRLDIATKGHLVASWPVPAPSPPRGLTAHVDTLGAMVREIKPNGRLCLTPLGGFAWNTVEGEGCTVFTHEGQQHRGSLLIKKASGHIFNDKVMKTKRVGKNMELRLDLPSTSPDETRSFGIEVGDFVAFDPRVETANGFIRSRHLDDKSSVACLLAAIKGLSEAGESPTATTIFHFSTYEEVGHGAASGFPPDLTELVTVDMAVVGPGQASDEFHATLCVKDARGPYHHGLNQRLRELAERYQIPYKVDTYPFYGSDGEAYWRAGGDVAVALIGPGVDASHNYERTHMDALTATTRWIMAYLLN